MPGQEGEFSRRFLLEDCRSASFRDNRRGRQLDQFEAARHQEPPVIGNDAHTRPAGGLQGLRVLRNTGHLGLQLRGQAQAHDVAVTVDIAAFGIADGCGLFRRQYDAAV